MLENEFIHIDNNAEIINDSNRICDDMIKSNKKVPKRQYKKRKQYPFTYEEYNLSSIDLTSYTVPILKEVCKSYKLGVSGRKQAIIERIKHHFNCINKAIILQTYIRMYFAKMIIKKHKENKLLRDSCVNGTDFSTLEPLAEINVNFIYCYKDTDNFVYGFHIASLIELIRSTTTLTNPYNRMPISQIQRNNIISVYNLSVLLNPSFKELNLQYYNYVNPHTRPTIRNQYINRLNQIELENQRNMRETSSYNHYQPYRYVVAYTDPVEDERYQRIVSIRQQPMNMRITQLFMEIDRLGNYTQSSWFADLTHLQYARLYRSLYDIWNYRAQLSFMVKIQICPFHGPFEGIFPNTIRHIDLSIDDLQRACIIVLENMTYSGTNDEFKQLGVMHALTALTIVSHDARIALPWLYESVAI